MGHFSSDRAVREYAEQIWGVTPVPISKPPTDLAYHVTAALPALEA